MQNEDELNPLDKEETGNAKVFPQDNNNAIEPTFKNLSYDDEPGADNLSGVPLSSLADLKLP